MQNIKFKSKSSNGLYSKWIKASCHRSFSVNGSFENMPKVKTEDMSFDPWTYTENYHQPLTRKRRILLGQMKFNQSKFDEFNNSSAYEENSSDGFGTDHMSSDQMLSYKMITQCAIMVNGRKCYRCPNCHRDYSLTTTLYNHLSYCGKPRRFKCQFCSYSAKLKQHLFQHLKRIHSLVKKSRFDDTLIKADMDGSRLRKMKSDDPLFHSSF